MPRRNGRLMSDQLKYELARELGVAHIVEREGWGAVPSRDCGNLVKLAIQRAEQSLSQTRPNPDTVRRQQTTQR